MRKLFKKKSDSRVNPAWPIPAWDASLDEWARWSLLAPNAEGDVYKAAQRERDAARSPITAMRCQYCGEFFPLSVFASPEKPLYAEDVDRIQAEHLYDHDCQWAIEARGPVEHE